MRYVFMVLLILGIVTAATVAPKYIGVKDTGKESLPKMDISIMINCDNKDLSIKISSNDSGSPVSGASEYLFYTDYGYQPIGSAKTGADGTVGMKVPGTINFLTGLFILRSDHSGHQSREIEFSYESCFKPQPAPPKNTTAPPKNDTPPASSPTSTANNTTSLPPLNNTTIANTTEPPGAPAQPNDTDAGGDAQKPASACPLGVLMLAMLFIKARI
jgi:hypothetical protein